MTTPHWTPPPPTSIPVPDAERLCVLSVRAFSAAPWACIHFGGDRPCQGGGRCIGTSPELRHYLALLAEDFGVCVTRAPTQVRALYTHAAWTVSAEDVRSGRIGQECDLLPGGRCFGEASGLDGDRLPWGEKAEQPIEFWWALVAYGRAAEYRMRARRADLKVRRCSCCEGAGLVDLQGKALTAEAREEL